MSNDKQYRLDDSGLIFNCETNEHFPPNISNRHYQEYLKWIDGGGKTSPAPVSSAKVPNVVSMLNARLALHRAGLLVKTEEALTALQGSDGIEARLIWSHARTVRRDNPLVNELSKQLNISDKQLDEMFIDASLIV